MCALIRRVAAAAILALSISSQATAEICVEVDLRFTEREPSRALVQSMKNEVSAIWKPYAVGIQWSGTMTLTGCASLQGSFDVLVDHQPLRPATSPRVMLGSTRVPLQAIDHSPIYIDSHATEHVLASLTVGELVRLLGRPDTGPADVGRALGRVLAHEMGHVLLGAPYHQQHGLLRPSFVPADLVQPQRWSYTLSRAEETRLRQREIALNAQLGARVVPSSPENESNLTSQMSRAGVGSLDCDRPICQNN